MPNSDSSVSSSGSASVHECLSNLSSVIRELEAVVSSGIIPGPGPRGIVQQDVCPHDHSQLARSLDGRQSVSRGCPFGQNSHPDTGSLSLQDSSHTGFVPRSKSGLQRDELSCSSASALRSEQQLPPVIRPGVLKELPENGEYNLDVTVEDCVVVTEDQEKISERNTRNIFHLRKTLSGDLVPREKDTASGHKLSLEDLPMFTNSGCVDPVVPCPDEITICDKKDKEVATEIEQELARRVMWEQTTELEHEQQAPGVLRRVRSRENIRAFRAPDPEQEPSSADLELLSSIREARQKVKCLQDEVKDMLILNETPTPEDGSEQSEIN